MIVLETILQGLQNAAQSVKGGFMNLQTTALQILHYVFHSECSYACSLLYKQVEKV